ncbi:MAG: hypothetical protein J5827_03630 [Oscillospiraceae bacterium]|nr:hypothetical protein [Oscillospiraceae bacterium]
MAEYSEQDLKYAAEFREGVHRDALAIVRKTRPDVTEVVDSHPVEDYIQEHWDYPGKWYTMVGIPHGYNRRTMIDSIVRATLSAGEAEAGREAGRRALSERLDSRPDGYGEEFTVDVDQQSRSFRAVGTDAAGRHILEHYEEYSLGSATGSTEAYYVLTDTEYVRYARIALINGNLSEADYERIAAKPDKAQNKAPKRDKDPFCELIAEYPDCGVSYRIVKQEGLYLGYESHRAALKKARQGEAEHAAGKRIDADELFSSDYRDGEPKYRRAFLYPPGGNSCTGKDFVRVNAALFPNGTDGLEGYRWISDRPDALCLTVFDKSLGRFAVITAPASGRNK